MFSFYKIIVLRDTYQFHSDLDHTTRMYMYMVYMETDKLWLFLETGFFFGCANSNRPVPGQQTSIVAC
jgi:hypothetical protein